MRKLARLLIPWLIVGVVVFGAFMLFPQFFGSFVYAPTSSSLTEGVRAPGKTAPAPAPSQPGSADTPAPEQVTVVATGLRVPWDIAFLPDGDMLVTERPGTLRRIGKQPAAIEVEGVYAVGEGGLMGVALHPKFAENGLLYLAFTTNKALENKVVRYRLDGGKLLDAKPIVVGIPGNQYHDGGRIAFGPDGMLYVTTGDGGNAEAAQEKDLLAGKILRVGPDGETPADNPFGTLIWSYGHRNPQGLAWDGLGRLWATEHGRSGSASGYDELNMIEKGKNYGWPDIEGPETRVGMVTPARQSGATETWAPAGMAWLDGSLYFAGLRGVSLYQVPFDGDNIAGILAHFRGDYGRLRAVTAGPDGALYVSTSNRDGRGRPAADDDRILRIDPSVFRR